MFQSPTSGYMLDINILVSLYRIWVFPIDSSKTIGIFAKASLELQPVIVQTPSIEPVDWEIFRPHNRLRS